MSGNSSSKALCGDSQVTPGGARSDPREGPLSAAKKMAPQVILEALMFGLRRGVEELTKPEALQRLSQLSQAQLLEVCERLQNFKPSIATAWTPEEVDAVAKLWSKVHENG
jgi:hypothetical protein